MRSLAAMMIWFLLPLQALAQTVHLRAHANELVVGQSALISIQVVDGQPLAVPQLAAPEGLRLQFERSETSTKVQFKVTRVVSYVYRVTALAEGDFTLGPVELELAGGNKYTGTVDISVKPRAVDADAPIEAEAGFDAQSVWEGQVVVYRYVLRSKVRVLRSSWTLPTFEGLQPPRDGDRPRRENVVEDPDGAVLVDETWIPMVVTGTGDLSQPSAVVRVDVPASRQRRDPFRDPFGVFTQSKPEVFATEKAVLKSKQLPPPPKGFSGLVGDFDFVSAFDKDKVAVGESVVWSVAVSGNGTLEGFALPTLDGLEGAQLYDNGPAVGARVVEGNYTAGGRFERIVVPTVEGRLSVPPLDVVVFSPSKGDYVTHRVAAGSIEVVPGREGAAELESFSLLGGGEAPTAHVAEDIRPIWRRGFDTTPWFGDGLPLLLGLAGFPGLWLLALVGREALAERLKSETPQGPPAPLERLSALPADPEARLAVLDGALRDAAQAATPDELLRSEMHEVRRMLNRARFAGDGGADLEGRVRAVIEQLEVR